MIGQVAQIKLIEFERRRKLVVDLVEKNTAIYIAIDVGASNCNIVEASCLGKIALLPGGQRPRTGGTWGQSLRPFCLVRSGWTCAETCGPAPATLSPPALGSLSASGSTGPCKAGK